MSPDFDKSTEPRRHYAVFISYRHLDNKEPGRQWASWLHQTLETYEVPKDLVGKINDRKEPVPETLYPVFRDEQELQARADLTQAIRQALENSELLIVLCSPRAAESHHVADEVKYFKELGRSNHILALIIDGEPNADGLGKAKLGIEPKAECLPGPLRYGVVTDTGKIDWSQRTEPICADVRPEGRPEQGWTTAAAYREALEKTGNHDRHNIAAKVLKYQEDLELAKLKIVAGALGIGLGIITERDKAWQLQQARARARRLKKIVVGFAMLAAAAIIAGTVAFHERNAAIQTLSQSDFLQAGRFISENNRGDALAYLVRSIKENPKNQAAVARLTALLEYHSWMLPYLVMVNSNAVRCAEFSTNGERIVSASDDGTARIWDAQTGSLIASLRHSNIVWCAQFSPDGKRVVTTSADCTAKIWNTQNGQKLQLLQHSNSVEWAEFSPDGKEVVTACDDGYARIWNLQTGQHVNLKTSNVVWHAEYSRDGKNVVTASADGTARVWTHNGTLVATLNHTNTVWCAKFSPDGEKVITASDDWTAQIWDLKQCQPPLILQHRNRVVWAEFSPDGKNAVTASWDDTARVWNAKTGDRVSDPMRHNTWISIAGFSPDGKRVLTGSLDYTARIWDAQTGEPLTESLKHGNLVTYARFSPDGKQVLTASHDGMVRVWHPLSSSAGSELLPCQNVKSAEFSPDGNQILLVTTNAVQVWDVEKGRSVAMLPVANILSARFSPDGIRFVAAFGTNACVWNARNAELVAELQYTNALSDAQFSPDGQQVAATAGGSVIVWNIHGGQPYAKFQNMARVIGVQFSPDGNQLISVTTNTVEVWNLKIGRLLTTLRIPAVSLARLSPDGRRIFVASPLITGSAHSIAHIWDWRTGKQLGLPMEHGGDFVYAEFDSNGRRLVTASSDHTARIWDAKTGKPLTQALSQSGQVYSARFSRDGKWIVTASRDRTAQVWDAQTGQPLAEPFQHADPVYSAQFSPDGQRILTVAANDRAQIWDFVPPPAKYPIWLLPLADAVAGETLDQHGMLELTSKRAEFVAQIKKELEESPDDDVWDNWGRWFLTDPTTRAISPFSRTAFSQGSE